MRCRLGDLLGGLLVGEGLGAVLGGMDIGLLGAVLGCVLGGLASALLGSLVGVMLGSIVGFLLGASVGRLLEDKGVENVVGVGLGLKVGELKVKFCN